MRMSTFLPITVCQQPNYFPWLGYLEQCAAADTLVFLDSVQWLKQGQQHRARILPHLGAKETAPGAKPPSHWLTLPVKSRGHRNKTIAEMQIAGPWADDHWRTLRAVYGRRPYFKSQLETLIVPWFESMGENPSLAEVAAGSVRLCLDALGFQPRIVESSQVPAEGRATARLVSLCQATSARIYYTGVGSTYIENSLFRAADIELVWQRWKHPEYEQGRAKRQTHLSVLDALANVPLAEIAQWIAIKPAGPLGQETRAYLDALENDGSLPNLPGFPRG